MPLHRATPTWQAYTPTLGGAGWAIGNGTIVGRFCSTPARVDLSILITFGTTSTYGGGNMTISLPSTPHAEWTDPHMRAAVGITFADATGNMYSGRGALSGALLVPVRSDASTATTFDNDLSSTLPFGWTNADRLAISGWYRPA